MDGIGVAIIVLGIIVGYPIFYYLIYEPSRFLLRVLYLTFFARLNESQKSYMGKTFSFYKQLSLSNQKRFERRVAFFLRYKKFKGVDVTITEEMKMFISACAVQLTFGLRNFWITEFDLIRVHAQSYDLANFNYKASGHTSEKGTITFSWKDLQEGVANPTDGVNVGLHEMAHALMISSIQKGWNINFASEFRNYERIAAVEWRKKETDERALRKYAYRNMQEFFAVSTEFFFEKPQALQQSSPVLFDEIKRLLRLDPLNAQDPILKDISFIYPPQLIPLPRYNPLDLVKMIFQSPISIVSFAGGTFCWVMGLKLVYDSIRFVNRYPNANYDYNIVRGASILFLVGMILYIEVFYNPKKDKTIISHEQQQAGK